MTPTCYLSCCVLVCCRCFRAGPTTPSYPALKRRATIKRQIDAFSFPERSAGASSGRIKTSYENIRTDCGVGAALFAGDLQPVSHRVDAGEGRVSLRPGGPAVPRLCCGAGGECAGACASADCEGDSGAGGEAGSRLQSFLPPESRGAGGAGVDATTPLFWQSQGVFFPNADFAAF